MHLVCTLSIFAEVEFFSLKKGREAASSITIDYSQDFGLSAASTGACH